MTLILLLFAFAILVYKKPTFAVGFILALAPTYLVRLKIGDTPTTFLELLILIFLAVTFLVNFSKLKELKALKTINWISLLFVLAGLISVFISPEKEKALGIFKAFVVEPVLFFYAIRFVLKKPSDLKIPLSLLFISTILISLFGIIQYFTLWHLPFQFWGSGSEVERITSVFPHPNALALYLSPLVTFFISLFILQEKTLNRKNLALGIMPMVIALGLTFSRGGWLAAIFTVLVLCLYRYSWKKVLVIGLMLLAVLFVIPKTRQRLNLISNDASSTAHFGLMSAALQKIGENPIFGNGLFGFRATLAEQNFQGEILNYPHNIFLNFWVEMGILGLVSFLGVIFVSIKQYKLHPTWYKLAATAFLITMMVHGQVDSAYFKNDLSLMFWFMISLFYI